MEIFSLSLSSSPALKNWRKRSKQSARQEPR